MNAVGTAIKVAGTAIIGAFVAGGTAALASGKVIEQYRLSLTTLMGSSKAAGEAVASALNLAAKTPFTDDQLLAATVALTKFGQDAKTVLPQVANMAAATNGDVGQAAEAYGRFLLGQTKALASFGITKAQVLAEGAKTEQGIEIANQKGQIVNQAAFNTALLSLMDKRFKAGAELQANSLAGLIKGMKDTGEDILRTIAGFSDDGTVRAGSMFDFFKQEITAVLAKVEEWKANGSLQEWADNVGKAISIFFTDVKIVFNWLVDIATWIARNWQAIVPVIAGVVGAFVAFKAVTIYVDVAAVAVKLFGAAVAGTLGPLGWITAAVAALAAGIAYLIGKQQQENALLNPSLVGAASVEHIKALRAAMAEYDAVTEKTGSQMLEKDQAGYYASRVAGHQKYVNDIKEQNDLLAKAALDSRNATSKAVEDGYAKTVADAAAAAKSQVALDADLANKILDLTQTKLQSALRAIDVEAAKKLADGKNEVQVAEWVRVSKIAAYKEAADASAKLTEAATKKTSEEAAKILGINADLNDQLYKLRHTTIENQIYDLAKVRDAAIAAGGSKLAADKVYVLASKKVYADAAAAQLIADKEAADKALQAKKDAEDKYLSAVADYTSKQQDVRSSLARTIINNYGRQEDVAITALEKERDTAIDTINDQIDARNRQLETTLDNISKEKDAALGIFDVQISALEATHAAAQRAETLAGLRADIATAKLAVETAETPEDKERATKDLLRAQKALDKELANEAYNDKLDSLRQQKAAASDFWDAQTKAAQTVAESDLQILKDQVTATQKSYDDRIGSVKSYYADLMLQRNADAEAEKVLASNTQAEILAMLEGRLGDWKALGAEISDAMFGDALAAKAALLALGATNVPGTSAPISPTWNQGAGQAGYGTFPIIQHGTGGYFTTPHIAAIAEAGPEFIVPQSQASAFAGRMGGMPVNVTYNINGASDIPAIRLELQHHDKELLGMLRGGRW
jgi:hypothetical protein